MNRFLFSFPACETWATPMPCAHFAGLTERFAREIEAVKTQYPFEDRKIQCALIALDTNRISLFDILLIPFPSKEKGWLVCFTSFRDGFGVSGFFYLLLQDLKWKHPCLRLKHFRQIELRLCLSISCCYCVSKLVNIN